MSYIIDGQSYTKCKQVPLTAASATLSAYPAPIVLTDANINASANADYSDLRFTSDSAGTSLLYHEFLSGTTSGGTAKFWVNVTSITTGTNVIYVWFGSASQTQQTAAWQANTWNSDFGLVAHLSEATNAVCKDSTPYANNSTVHTFTSVAATGCLPAAASMSTQQISFPNATQLNPTVTATVSGWIYLTGAGAQQTMLENGTGTSVDDNLELIFGSPTANQMGFSVRGTSGSQYQATTTNFTKSAWHYIVGKYDGAHAIIKIDDTKVVGAAYTGAIHSNTQPLKLGFLYTTTWPLVGVLAEFRLESNATTDDWDTYSYNAMKSITGAVSGALIWQWGGSTWTWSSASSTDMNNSANYTQTGSGTFAAGDLVYPNTAGLANTIATGNLTCNSLTVNASVTYQFSLATFVLTVSSNSAISGGSSNNLGAGITLNGGVTFTLANIIMIASNCVITSNGTGNIWADSGIDSGGTTSTYYNVVVNSSCNLTLSGSTSYSFSGQSNLLILYNNSTITTNSVTNFIAHASGDIYTIGSGCTWKGSGNINIGSFIGGTMCTLPTLTYTGTATNVRILPFSQGGTIITITGNINVGSTTQLLLYSHATTYTLNMGSNTLTCGLFACGNDVGAANFNYNSVIINCTSFSGNTYNAGVNNEDFGSCIINCSGSFTLGSTHFVKCGTSTINITNTATITTYAALLYNITINASGKFITLANTVYCNSLTLTAGTITYAGFSVMQLSLYTVRKWSSSGSTNANLATNYSGSGALLTTDVLLYDNSSVVNSTTSNDLSVAAIIISAGYTGAWSNSGHVLTVALSSTINGGGTRDLGNGITLNGNALSFTIGNATMTATSCAIVSNGVGNLWIESTGTNGSHIYLSITINTSCGLSIVPLINASYFNLKSSSTPLTLQDNASFITAPNTAIQMYFELIITQTNPIYSMGINYSWSGAAQVVFIPGASNITITIPSVNFTGLNGGLNFFSCTSTSFTNVIYNFTGIINIGTLFALSCYENQNIISTFNFGTSIITCGKFQCGPSASTPTININYQLCTINCTSYAGNFGNVSICNEDFGSSIWNCSGSWTFGSNHTITPGSSTVNITNSSIIIGSPKSFNNLVINASGKTVTFGSNLFGASFIVTAGTIAYATYYWNPRIWNSSSSMDMNATGNYNGTSSIANSTLVFDGSLSVINAIATADLSCVSVTVTTGHTGTWSNNGHVLTISASTTVNGGGTRDLGNGITMNGNSVTLTIANATMTSTSFVLTNNGISNTYSDSRGGVIAGITNNVSCSLIVSQACSLKVAAVPFINNGSFTNNDTMQMCSTVSGYVFIGAGSWNGTGEIIILISTFVVVNALVSAITYTGSGQWTFRDGSFTSGSSITFMGTINVAANNFRFYEQYGYTYTIDFNDQNVICGSFQFGNSNAGITVFYYKSGTFNVTSFSGSTFNYATGTCTEDFGSSIWNCSGSWTFGSNHTITSGSSTVNITNTATITSNGKSFYNLNITSGSGHTVTLADNLVVTGRIFQPYGTTGGTFAVASKTITAKSCIVDLWGTITGLSTVTGVLHRIPQSSELVFFYK